jgi:hypothetical protein
LVILGPYPSEASFYPELIIVPFITLAIFSIILYLIATIKIRNIKGEDTTSKTPVRTSTEQKEVEEKDTTSKTPLSTFLQNKKKERQLGTLKKAAETVRKGHITDIKTGDVIAIVGLIATIVVPLLIPLVQAPIIDYVTKGPFNTNKDNIQRFEIVINNIGIAADHVIVSLTANNTTFLNFTSQPFLAKHVNATTNKVGSGLLDIDNLPAGSQIIITATVSSSANQKPQPELTTYVHSSKVVGYHQIYDMFIFYLALFVVYAILAVIFGSGLIPLTTKEIRRDYRKFAVCGVIISSGIVAGNMLLYLPYLHTTDILYLIYYFIGPLLIPVTILTLLEIFLIVKPSGWEFRRVSFSPRWLVLRFYYQYTLTVLVILALFAATLYSYFPTFWGVIGVLGILTTQGVIGVYRWLVVLHIMKPSEWIGIGVTILIAVLVIAVFK